MLRRGKQLRNVTLNKSVLWLPTTRQIGTNAWLCSFQGSFCPPVKGGFDPTPTPTQPDRQLGSCEMHPTLQGCPQYCMPESSLGIIRLTRSREREDGLPAKCTFNTDSKRRSCKVSKAQIFSSSLSRLRYIATMPAHTGYQPS